MELLLWLWFYDTRWFFNLKISITCYKNAWLIPLFLNTFLMIICIYYFQLPEVYFCDKSLKLWLYTRTFFSFLISFTIIFFMMKIIDVNKKEQSAFETPIKIMPILENNMKQYEFWIRRKSLLSTPGILLLFLGLVSLFWSCLIVGFNHAEHIYKCDSQIMNLLTTHSIFIIAGNSPIALIFVTMVAIKLSCFISAFLCPNFLISISKPSPAKSMQVELIKYC